LSRGKACEIEYNDNFLNKFPNKQITMEMPEVMGVEDTKGAKYKLDGPIANGNESGIEKLIENEEQ